jgi:acyl-CoA thioesterase
MSGLEALRATLRGDIPSPPIDRLTGIRLEEAEDGRVVFAMPASGWLAQEFGAIFGGAIALLGMSAASAAVQTTAEPGTGFAALDVKVNLLRPVLPDGQDLVATGTVLHRGRRLAIGTSEVLHGGKRVAVVTGTTELRPGSGA